MKQDMDCKYCGKKNEKQMCVIFGPPEPNCPFSLSGIVPGKMCCLECYEKSKAAKVA